MKASQNKKQRIDPPVSDPPVIDITNDQTEECIVIDDDDDDDDNSKTDQNRRKENVNTVQAKAGVDHSDKEEIEIEEEEIIASGKRKRPHSPTEW